VGTHSGGGLPALALGALATYRLTKLIRDDKITEDLRNFVFERYGEPDDHKVSYLVTCPWCLSIYFGAAVSSVRIIFPNSKLVSAGIEALAFSALTGMLVEREEAF
jgi:hypothetical protein